MSTIDEYGSIDIYLDGIGWKHVHFEKNQIQKVEIKGATINQLIFAYCTIYGSESARLSGYHVEVPGGIDTWLTISKSVFPMLLSFCSIEGIFLRIFFIYHRFLESVPHISDDLTYLLRGAAIFLNKWILEYQNFMCLEHLLQVRDCVAQFCDEVNINEYTPDHQTNYFQMFLCISIFCMNASRTKLMLKR